MPRKKQVEEPIFTTLDEWRASIGLPPSKKIREHGKCYDCGEPLKAGPCGGFHSRLEEVRSKGFTVEFCCTCAGHGI